MDEKENFDKYKTNNLVAPLTQWIRDNPVDEKMIYRNSFTDQVCFVRDTISRILASSYEEYLGIQHTCLSVISTHTSKSIKLPVYELKFRDFVFILRGNFHDWKISVDVPYWCKPIDYADFQGLFNPDNKISSCYCEGFPQDKVYGSFNEYVPNATVDYAKRRFTIELLDRYQVYTFFYILNLKYIKTKT